MRKQVANVLCAVMMVGAACAVGGCKASASASVGSTPAKPPPPPPPPKPEPKAEPKPEPKVEAPKPEKKFEVVGGQLKLPGPVVFKTGSAELAPESDEVLSIVKDYLTEKSKISLLRIEGHTDMDGDDKGNQTLSEKRSMSVARWLVGKGIDCKRVIPVGFGEKVPVAGTPTKQTAEEKNQNRRTAFINAALDGKPIGGMPVDGGGTVAGDPCK